MRKLASVVIATAFSCALLLGARPSAAFGIGVSVNIEPPELPVYEQPEIPAPGYIWTPGYWDWAEDGSGYYWVPGTWVQAPEPGYLWTPGYWGFDNGAYLWHGGYWGTEIGFYGGVNYGFGYSGHGYDGGYWDHGAFRYNTAYNRIGEVRITNVYNKTVVNNVTVNHVSFNGGRGGIQLRPDEHEIAAERAHHLEPVAAQMQQRDAARGNPDLRLSANHGRPAIAATARPGEFSGHGVIASHGAPPAGHAPALNAAPRPATNAPVVHDHALAPQPHSVPTEPQHVQTAVPHEREQNVPLRPATPQVQRTPEVPHTVQPPHPPQQPKPPEREPERRGEEPHGVGN